MVALVNRLSSIGDKHQNWLIIKDSSTFNIHSTFYWKSNFLENGQKPIPTQK
jgi:hypothetical protein